MVSIWHSFLVSHIIATHMFLGYRNPPVALRSWKQIHIVVYFFLFELIRTVLFRQSFFHAFVCAYSRTLASKQDTWEKMANDKKCLSRQSRGSPHSQAAEEDKEWERNIKCFHPLNEKRPPRGSWECLRNGTVILRGKTKKQKHGRATEKKPSDLGVLRFLRQRMKPPSRDFIVISFVRRPVPGEVITLNRHTSDTDPGSYRCLGAW